MGTPLGIRRWQDITSLGAGTGAVNVVRIHTLEEAAEYAGKPCFIVGGGTNLVGLDQDTTIPALRVGNGQPQLLTNGRVRLSAGANLFSSIADLAKLGLGGMHQLCGIPGTVGGAAAMNAGAYGQEFANFALELTGWDMVRNRKWTWQRGEGGFGYRTSPVPPEVLLLTVDLQLETVDITEEQSRIQDELSNRKRRNPQGRSAGSVFRNPPGAEAAGMLLERAGCKELHQGPFYVSPQHANWILNDGSSTPSAEDAWALVQKMQNSVKDLCHIQLQPEWKSAKPVNC